MTLVMVEESLLTCIPLVVECSISIPIVQGLICSDIAPTLLGSSLIILLEVLSISYVGLLVVIRGGTCNSISIAERSIVFGILLARISFLIEV
jgi:hypothetical protein